jgi:hypothetical protein
MYQQIFVKNHKHKISRKIRPEETPPRFHADGRTEGMAKLIVAFPNSLAKAPKSIQPHGPEPLLCEARFSRGEKVFEHQMNVLFFSTCFV